jgi:hypothetical protein
MAPPPAGYAHPDYASTLGAERVLALPRSGGHLLVRRTPALPMWDAAGPYPILCCRDWQGLGDDLEEAGRELVSVVAVTDPFADVDPSTLARWFGDRMIAFKSHRVVDLKAPPESAVSTNHRRNARRALEEVSVERLRDPVQQGAEWDHLYRRLIDRHGIEGVAAFPPDALLRQLRVPGITAFRALHRGATVGMLLFYVQGRVAYYHLGAHDDEGYRLRASFGLFWRAIEALRDDGLEWLDLGAGAGDHDDPEDGLARFKRGWAHATRPAYLCGRIFDRAAYDRLVQETGRGSSPYFPAYRGPAAASA